MRITIGALAVSVLLLGACTPTLNPTVLNDAQGDQVHGAPGSLAMSLKGSACGQPFAADIADNKDRQQVVVAVECPNGGKITAQTVDSNGSTAMLAALAAQSAQNQRAMDTIDKLGAGLLSAAGVVVKPAVAAATGGAVP